MFERYAWRAGVGVVVLVVALGVGFAKRNSSSDEYRRKAHRLVAAADGYGEKPDYYDWLVDDAHDKVFGGAYHTERRSRYSSKSWVDPDEYYTGLFDCMIDQASADKATGVVACLKKLKAETVAE